MLFPRLNFSSELHFKSDFCNGQSSVAKHRQKLGGHRHRTLMVSVRRSNPKENAAENGEFAAALINP
jgi:hypothetical protein